MLLERAISCGQNLKSKNYMQSMKRFSMQSWTPILFFWVLGGGFLPLYQCVPTMFPKFPKTFPKASHVIWQMFLLSPIGRPKGKNSMLQNKTFYLGNFHGFLFLGDEPIKLVHYKNKQNQRTSFGGTHLINENHNRS